MYNASKFLITGSYDGGVPSKFIKLLTIPSPVYTELRVDDKPTEVIADTGSGISIIHSNFLKTIEHKKFICKIRTCQRANSISLNIIDQIEFQIKIKDITIIVAVYVATNLITSILFGNDWIKLHDVHLFGDQKRLTVPDQNNQLIAVPYITSTCLNYRALLIHEVTPHVIHKH